MSTNATPTKTAASTYVVEINQPEQLEQLRLIWSLLVAQTPEASLFHTLDWLQAYWKHFGGDQQLRVLVVYRANSPLGILPLTVVRETTRVGTVRVLTYPLRDWGTFFGPIGPNPTATLSLAMRHLKNTQRDWDLLDLRWVDGDNRDLRRTPDAMQRAGLTPRESAWKTTSLIDLTGDWQGYWQSRTSKFRNNLRRDEKRLRACGVVEYVRYRPAGKAYGDDDPRWDLFDICTEIARASWQGASDNGTTLSHEAVAAFFRDAHLAAVKNGMVDISILKIDGRPVAFSYNYVSDGRLIGMRRGHLPEYAHVGAGNVLLLYMLRDSCQRGDVQLDMGPGSYEIKRRWTTRSVDSYRYTHYPWSSPRVQLLRLGHLSRRSGASRGK